MASKSENIVQRLKNLTDENLLDTAFRYRVMYLRRKKDFERTKSVYHRLIDEMHSRGIMNEFLKRIRGSNDEPTDVS